MKPLVWMLVSLLVSYEITAQHAWRAGLAGAAVIFLAVWVLGGAVALAGGGVSERLSRRRPAAPDAEMRRAAQAAAKGAAEEHAP